MRALFGLLPFLTVLAACAVTDEPPATPLVVEPPGPPVSTAAHPPPGRDWDVGLPPDVRLVDDDDHGATHRFVRVVHDRTGAPLAGATIDGWWEATTAHAEPWENLHEQRVVADVDGWALVRTFEGGNWWYVEAPGFAPFGSMGLDDEIRLEPGVDVPIEIRDWLDRPRAGVEIELLLGCGHSPAVRTVVTDTRGRAVLSCVKPGRGYLWLRGEGLRGLSDGYDGGWDELPVEDGHLVLHAEPAAVLEGTVLYHDGTPAVDAAVGGHDSHRGPWTATDEQGRFRLVGLGDDDVTIHAWPYPGAPEDAGTHWGEADLVPGMPAVIRLEPPDWLDVEAEDEEEDWPVVRLVVNGVAEEVDLPVRAARRGDGLAVLDSLVIEPPGNSGELALPEGNWTLEWGGPVETIARGRTELTVGKDGAELRIRIERNPVWTPTVVELDAEGFAHDYAQVGDGGFTVLAAGGVEEWDADDLPLVVPAKGPFAVVFHADDGRVARVVLDGPPEGDGPALVLPPVDEAPEVPPMMTVPYAGDFPEEVLHVLLPGGAPAAGADLTIRGSFAENMHYALHDSLDAAGTTTRAFRRGDEVTISVDEPAGLPPLVARITEPGPWTLHWPDGSIAVTVVDAAGERITTAVDIIVAGTHLWAEDGALQLIGLPAGPVRFQVAAPGYRPHDLRVFLEPHEQRVVTVTLQQR